MLLLILCCQTPTPFLLPPFLPLPPFPFSHTNNLPPLCLFNLVPTSTQPILHPPTAFSSFPTTLLVPFALAGILFKSILPCAIPTLPQLIALFTEIITSNFLVNTLTMSPLPIQLAVGDLYGTTSPCLLTTLLNLIQELSSIQLPHPTPPLTSIGQILYLFLAQLST